MVIESGESAKIKGTTGKTTSKIRNFWTKHSSTITTPSTRYSAVVTNSVVPYASRRPAHGRTVGAHFNPRLHSIDAAKQLPITEGMSCARLKGSLYWQAISKRPTRGKQSASLEQLLTIRNLLTVVFARNQRVGVVNVKQDVRIL